MQLDEVESQRAMLAALAQRDPELEGDIERALRSELSTLDDSNYTTEWELGMETDDYVSMVDAWVEDDGMMSVPEALAGRHSEQVTEMLAAVPTETKEAAVREQIMEAAEAAVDTKRQRRPTGIFEFAGGRGGGIDLRPVAVELQVCLREPLSWVPAERVVEYLAEQHGGSWEEMAEGTYSTGWTDGYDNWRLEERSSEAILEWADDLRREYFSGLVDAEPKVAVKAFLGVLASDYPDLSKRIKKAKLPADVLADYAVAYFTDPEEGIEVISEALGVFGYEGTKADVVLEIDQGTLRELGIVGGRWWDGAPWRLVNLPPAELAYEGTLMRHCVGSFTMGYREAVERGETLVWSLRSRFNKPILTFEIDRYAWQSGAEMGGAVGPQRRAGAIEQLKGKLNRAPGEDWQEARVLNWILHHLQVDPTMVRDFGSRSAWEAAYRPPGERDQNPGFDGPWQPYQARARARLVRWR